MTGVSLYRYGDKTPKSPLGRVFGVAFILVGLVVVALFTGSVTSVLTNKPGLLDGAGDETVSTCNICNGEDIL